MVYRVKKLTIWDTPDVASITAYTGSAGILLTNLEGWDELPDIRRNTAPVLFGHGEYQSTAASFDSKLINITLFTQYPDEISVRALRTNVRIIGTNLNTLIPISLTYYEDGVEIFKEVLYCRPATEFIEDWVQLDNSLTFTLSFIAPNPFKDVYLNGSETKEANGRL